MSSPYRVQLHQSGRTPSIGSTSTSYSSASSTRSPTYSELRHYDADKHAAYAVNVGGSTVISYRTGPVKESGAPSPSYSVPRR